jgi:hypothetical protein
MFFLAEKNRFPELKITKTPRSGSLLSGVVGVGVAGNATTMNRHKDHTHSLCAE